MIPSKVKGREGRDIVTKMEGGGRERERVRERWGETERRR